MKTESQYAPDSPNDSVAPNTNDVPITPSVAEDDLAAETELPSHDFDVPTAMSTTDDEPANTSVVDWQTTATTVVGVVPVAEPTVEDQDGQASANFEVATVTVEDRRVTGDHPLVVPVTEDLGMSKSTLASVPFSTHVEDRRTAHHGCSIPRPTTINAPPKMDHVDEASGRCLVSSSTSKPSQAIPSPDFPLVDSCLKA